MEKSLTLEMRHFFFDFSPFLGPSLKGSFSKLRRSSKLCFGYVGGEVGANRGLLEILRGFLDFGLLIELNPMNDIVQKHQILSRRINPIQQCTSKISIVA